MQRSLWIQRWYAQAVGVKAVHEVIPAIKMYNATAAWVVTNSTYTKQSFNVAKLPTDQYLKTVTWITPGNSFFLSMIL